jgi:CubicO group peptidase (beta-lactamase class C family)
MRKIIILGLLLIIQNGVFSQNLVTLDSLLKIHQNNGFNGNVLYSRNDSIIFKGNYGYSNIEKQIELTDESIFDLASISKLFTAICIVQLVEKGLITYETKINSIFPLLSYKDITIEHLLRHQSGLPDYMSIINKKNIGIEVK